MKIKSDIHAKFEEIGELIRTGQGAIAKSKLLLIDTKKLTTSTERVHFGSLARRLSLPNESLKVLHPIVRPLEHKFIKATAEECTEYAVGLIKVGAINEALTILNSLPSNPPPNAFLFKAFAYIAEWDYENAIVWLKKYINCNSVSQYERLVAKANLCEALAYLKLPEYINVINTTIEEAKENNYTIILGHLEKTNTSFAIETKDWDTARESLVIAEKCLASSDSIEGFFVRKWKVILQYSQDKKHPASALNKIREEALQKWKHWETVRDCDYHEALITKNETLLSRLYFGTPYPSFRKRLLTSWGRNPSTISTFKWELNTDNKTGQKLEFFSGNTTERNKLLKSRKQIAALIRVLSTDFYRPMRTAQLYTKLCPDQYFNPQSSPGLIRLAIHRTRSWLKKEKIPLVITETNGMYSLSSSKPVQMIIPANLNDTSFESVAQKFDLAQTVLINKDSFSVQEVSSALNLKRSTTNRLITQAIESGLIVRIGSGKQTKYVWANSQRTLLKAA